MITEIISTSVYRRESFVISAGFTSYTFQSSAHTMHIESQLPLTIFLLWFFIATSFVWLLSILCVLVMTLTCWTIMLPKKSTGIISLFFSSSYTMPHLTVKRGEKRPFLFFIFQLISRWFSFLTLSSSQKIWDRHSQRERRKRVHQTAIAWLLCIFHARHFFFFLISFWNVFGK